MREADKNDTVKFKNCHMQIMQPFMIIADFETYTKQSKKLKPYSFAMFTHCIFHKEKNKLTQYTGDNALDNFIDHLITHVNYIDKSKAKGNPYSNLDVCKSNIEYPTCLICSKTIDTKYNAHGYKYYCKKTGNLLGFRHQECREQK